MCQPFEIKTANIAQQRLKGGKKKTERV